MRVLLGHRQIRAAVRRGAAPELDRRLGPRQRGLGSGHLCPSDADPRAGERKLLSDRSAKVRAETWRALPRSLLDERLDTCKEVKAPHQEAEDPCPEGIRQGLREGRAGGNAEQG